MTKYVQQLLQDLEAINLAKWQKQPPHCFEMGVFADYITPPLGYTGPPHGFGQDRDRHKGSPYLEKLHTEDVIEEVEAFVRKEESYNMYDYFGLEEEQFPPAETLADDELAALMHGLLNVWAAFNYMPSFPPKTPPRILYPLFIDRMKEPTMCFKHGNMGVEFCHYEPEQCPFGAEFCICNDDL